MAQVSKMIRRGRVPQRQSSSSVHLPAPVGGLNTLSPASAMPPGDCLQLLNMIPYQYGLRVRSGYREWATHVGDPVAALWLTATLYPVGTVVRNQYGQVYRVVSNASSTVSVAEPTGTTRFTDTDPSTVVWEYVSGLYPYPPGNEPGAWVSETPGGVRTVVGFTGSDTTGANDRLWAMTSDGIYDITLPTGAPTRVFTFDDPGYQPSMAGHGVGTAFVNVAGEHFFAYCDGFHGYYLYRESTNAWIKIEQSTGVAWQQMTSYSVGNTVVNNGNTYRCTVSGTAARLPPSAAWALDTGYAVGNTVTNGTGNYICTTAGTSAISGGGPTGTGTGIADNTVVWDSYVPGSGPTTLEASITDGTVTWTHIYGVVGIDPSTFRFVMQWKSRLWFVPENSATAQYLDVGAFAGTAYPMPFAPRFKSGGELVGLWSWTVDGGFGIDDFLVGISSGGDVVVYAGTDPSIPGAFTLRGVWWVGRPPPGRRIASNFGGDLFILSVVGCTPLSKLVSGAQLRDPTITSSLKVSNLFNKLMTERSEYMNWGVQIHPTDNTMVVNVPQRPGEVGLQLVMSLANQGWSKHIGVPMACMETWRNRLYFGTVDGRVCANEGQIDNQPRDHAAPEGTVAVAIEWALQTAYQNAGTPAKKRIHMVRPYFVTDGTPPGTFLEIRYDFDISNISLETLIHSNSITPAWDVAIWDTSVWDDSAGKHDEQFGVTGIGSNVSVVMKGSSTTATTFVGFDVMVEKGGLL